ncbi:MAG: hypothetical protein AMJ79_13430, partial [Phycisphaerae bacterium SM23_30]
MNRLPKHLIIALMAVFLVLGLNLQTQAQVILTPSEESGFQEYTGYEEMLQFLQEIQASSTEMLLSD